MHICIVGTIEIISVYVFMKMHLYSHLSISTIIQRTRLIWVPVIAYILLGERLGLFYYVGISVLFIGLSISAAPRKIMTDKGMQYAYLSAFFAAVLAIAVKFALRDMSVGWIMIAMSLLPTLIIPLFMKNAPIRLRTAVQINPTSKLISSGANTVAMILLTMSIKIGSLSIATAIYQSMMLVSILVGIFIFQEREGLAKKIIGGTITVVAILIITLL
jgi:drug/metabolite transporter (DMT)-like permease